MGQFRVNVPVDFLIKEALKYSWRDWPTMSTLIKLQLARETFNWRHPLGADGRGETVRQISLRLTDRCQLRCQTCGQWGPNGYLRGQSLAALKQRELPLATYQNLVDQVQAAGWAPVWYIWGGEPMLYPHLFKLLNYIADRRMPINMVSNGVRMLRHVDDIISTCKGLWLSIDGSTAETHNRQRPGVSAREDNFSEVMAALTTLSEEKKRRGSLYPYLGTITTISKYNAADQLDIYRLVNPYADIHMIYLAWWIDPPAAQAHAADFERRFGFVPTTPWGWVGDWKEFDSSNLWPQFESMWQLSKARHRCPALLFPSLKSAAQIEQYYREHTATFGYRQCFNIYTTLEIDSNGDVSLCRDYRDYIIGNINTQSITGIWHSEAARRFRGSISRQGLLPVCRRCCGLMGY